MTDVCSVCSVNMSIIITKHNRQNLIALISFADFPQTERKES